MTISKTGIAGPVVAGLFAVLSTQSATAASVSPDVIFGSGNANGSFTVATGTYATGLPDGDPQLEIGLRAKLRFNDSNLPENTFNYDGVDTYTFTAGLPPTGFGFAPGNTQAATWNFEWHVNTDKLFVPAFGASSLNALTYELRIDGDPGAGTNFAAFDPINVPLADHAIGRLGTANGGGTVAGDAATYATLLNENSVAQNSWNYLFFVGQPELSGFDPTVAGSYRIEFEAFYQGNSVASTGINVNVVSPVPLPAGMVLLITGVAGMTAMRRKRS